MKDRFQDIYRNNSWSCPECKSGWGSTLENTKSIRSQLPLILKKYGIQSIVDCPCGSFEWFHEMLPRLNITHYYGCDIVPELIDLNKRLYKDPRVIEEFLIKDLTVDEIPNCDLLFVRDCFVHLPYELIQKALNNLRNQKNNIKYLMTTSFTSRVFNTDIKLGDWRPINLLIEPFNLRNPLDIIKEGCEESNGIYQDKSLILFKMEDL